MDPSEIADLPDIGGTHEQRFSSAVRRYVHLRPSELRALRRQWQHVARQARNIGDFNEDVSMRNRGHEAETLADACEKVLEWKPYGWDWDYILNRSESIVRHAVAVDFVLRRKGTGNTTPTEIFRQAAVVESYDPDTEKHEETVEHEVQAVCRKRMRRETKDLSPDRDISPEAKVPLRAYFMLTTREEVYSDASSVSHTKIRNPYVKADWGPGSGREGTVEELELLTEAILLVELHGQRCNENPDTSK